MKCQNSEGVFAASWQHWRNSRWPTRWLPNNLKIGIFVFRVIEYLFISYFMFYVKKIITASI